MNNAAMLVRDIGISISKKNLMGPALSIFAASISSSGMVIKNCLNKKVAVAEAISGKQRPVYEFSKSSLAMTSKVGNIRTSTGSISVMKISQKKSIRMGNRKYTTA